VCVNGAVTSQRRHIDATQCRQTDVVVTPAGLSRDVLRTSLDPALSVAYNAPKHTSKRFRPETAPHCPPPKKRDGWVEKKQSNQGRLSEPDLSTRATSKWRAQRAGKTIDLPTERPFHSRAMCVCSWPRYQRTYGTSHPSLP